MIALSAADRFAARSDRILVRRSMLIQLNSMFSSLETMNQQALSMHSLIVLDVAENMEEIFRWLAVHPLLVHHRHEHITTRLMDVDLDASDDADTDVGYRLDNALDVLVRDRVHRVRELCHGLLCCGDLLVVWLEGFSDVDELVVEGAGAGWDLDRRCFVLLRLPFVALEPLEGVDGRTTRIIVEVLAVAEELSEVAVRRDANMGRKENDKVAASRHV